MRRWPVRCSSTPSCRGTTTTRPRWSSTAWLSAAQLGAKYWEAYSGGRDLDHDPFAVPLRADTPGGLPPALVVLGGCDMLRDEGRAYATRLREDGVEVDEVCYAGQPHGFVNFDFPAARLAFDRIGTWLRATLAGRAAWRHRHADH